LRGELQENGRVIVGIQHSLKVGVKKVSRSASQTSILWR
jgi:hypothetical protein